MRIALTPHRLDPVLRHLRNLGGSPAADLPDAALLARFAADGDEEAFAVIVRRHGPMVFGLCRRLLGDVHAAEDAFQATFLLLAKKARWLRQPDRLGPWLYGVARRVALKARSATSRRREVALVDVPAIASGQTDDLRPMLDAAIARLPDRYRAPVVLCYLEGLTYAEAAQRLRCPAGTIATRLSRAKDRLRVLLVRQGVVPAAGALAALLTPDATAAIVPDELLRSTVRWAGALVAGSVAAIPSSILTLTREVTQAMIFDKMKMLALVAVLGLAGTGAGIALSRPAGADAPDKPPAAKADAGSKPGQGGERPLPLVVLRQKPPDEYRVDAGDILGVFIEGILGNKNSTPPIINIPAPANDTPPAPAVGYPISVKENGTLYLPLLPVMTVRGKTTNEVRGQIEKAYIDMGAIRQGTTIMVSLAKPRTCRVTVIHHLSTTDAGTSRTQMVSLDLPAYENDVLTALAKSSFGLPYSTENAVVVIERGSAAGGVQEIRIPLRGRAGQPLPFKPEDVILKNGDVVSVEQN